MGRSKKNTVVLHNKFVSGRHCEIACEDGAYALIDLNSTNGIFVNGGRVKKQRLEDSDKILAGTSLIIYIADENAFRPKEFVRQLREGNREERELAASLLGQLGTTAVSEALASALREDPESGVKAAAAEALGFVGDSKAVGSLLALFDTSDKLVRGSVVRALVRLADSKAIDGLVAYLKHDDHKVRVLAAHTLGQIHNPRATEQLIKSLDDDSFVVREAVVKALGDIADPRAVKALMQAATKQDLFPQIWVIESLGKIRSPESMQIILRAIRSRDAEVREAAADALGGLRTEEAAPALLLALDDADPKVRKSAAGALEKLRVHFEMTKAFSDPSASGRKTVEIAAIGDGEQEGPRRAPKFGEDRSEWERWWAEAHERG